jgi:hypothetical protein
VQIKQKCIRQCRKSLLVTNIAKRTANTAMKNVQTNILALIYSDQNIGWKKIQTKIFA